MCWILMILCLVSCIFGKFNFNKKKNKVKLFYEDRNVES